MLHSADAVTARALVLNRWKKTHGVQDFLFGVVGFVWVFFGMQLLGSGQALEDGSPPRAGGRELSLVLNPRPVQGPPPLLVPQERRTKAGGETKVSPHCQLPNLFNEETSAKTSSGHKLTSFCVFAPTRSRVKLRQETFS